MQTAFPRCLVCDAAKRTYEQHEYVASDGDTKVLISF